MERIRIYELARQMNLSNQTLIDTLRELGFDVKSHSSTVDKNAFPLLVQALNKKKQADTGSTPKPAKAAKAAPPPPPPPPPSPPRVLNPHPPTTPPR
jgi:translation initiation factor IF-2